MAVETDQLQTEIAVVAGVLGGVCLILLICVIILTVMLNKMKKSLSKLSGVGHPAVNNAPARLDDDLSSRFSMYPPVAPPPKLAPLPAPTHVMNPSAYQGSGGGYEVNNRFGPVQLQQQQQYQPPPPQPPMMPRTGPNPTGRPNPAYVDDHAANRPRSAGGSYDYGY